MFKKKYVSRYCEICGVELLRCFPNLDKCKKIELVDGVFENADATPSLDVIGCGKCEKFWKELRGYNNIYKMTKFNLAERELNKKYRKDNEV